ncbi:MAG: AAA family ATPase [Lachnospiraceae bacterium]|nr:AAA family ATPase [Lachnospiraceae bacterium]
MNIKEAKDEIARSVEIYLDKNEFGEYNIPYMKQRPIFMIGAPGIGKTAIMEQIASELGIALVSYSMTHHTRQSAIGLPLIEERQYDGEAVKVSEYTMSEIIASVYRVMEESGKREGILFLDEINCLSETLAPAMLLFLQYKTFGNRRLPEGWVIVTAGNPPQYNKSVKEFDVATLDRLKCFSIEEDFGIWKSYAYQNGIHASIITFLEINPEWFYSIRTTVDGVQYVTARGWEDLSLAIGIYEKKKFDVNRNLVQQYITDTEIAGKFSIYYDLFKKYKSEYKVEDILHGILSQALLERVEKAGFDERISLLGLILENLNIQFDQTVHQEMVLERVVKILRIAKKETTEKENVNIIQLLDKNCAAIQAEKESAEAANSLNNNQKREYRDVIALLKEYMTECVKTEEPKKQFQRIKKRFDSLAKNHQNHAEEVKEYLENAFSFLAQAWGNGQEMILFMTELTANADSMHFIELWGSTSYFQYNQDLLIYDVHQKLQREITDLLSLGTV